LPRRFRVPARVRVGANRLAVRHPPRAAWSRAGGRPFVSICRSGGPAGRDGARAVAAVAVVVLIGGGECRPCWVCGRASSAGGALVTGRGGGGGPGARRAVPGRVSGGLRACPVPVPGEGRGSARGETVLIGVAGPVAAGVLEGPGDDSAVGYGPVAA
jgi:hypothetical protein